MSWPKRYIGGNGRFLRPYEWLYTHLKRHAGLPLEQKRGLLFELTFEQFLEFVKIPNCHYCERPVQWDVRSQRSKAYINLDRKDSNVGYRPDNLVVCCPFCNRIKCHLLSYEEMLILAPTLRQILAARTN